MARWCEPSAKDIREWIDRIASASPIIRNIADALDPWTLYRIQPSGFRGIIRDVRFDGRMVKLGMWVSRDYNLVLQETLLVVSYWDLEPCDLPGPGDRVGIIDVPRRVDGWVTHH